MPNPYPAKVTDESGVERLVGEIDFTDQANQPGAALAWQVIAVTGVAFTGGANTSPNFAAISGPAFVDLSTPNDAKIITAGRYLMLYALSVVSAASFLLPVGFVSNLGHASFSVPPDGTPGGGDVPGAMGVEIVSLSAGDSIQPFVFNPNAALTGDVWMDVVRLP